MTGDLKTRSYQMTVMSGMRERKHSGSFDEFASVLLRSELVSDGLAAPFRQQYIFLCWQNPKREPLGPIVFRRVSSGGEFGNQRAVAADLAEAMGLPLIDETPRRGRAHCRPIACRAWPPSTWCKRYASRPWSRNQFTVSVMVSANGTRLVTQLADGLVRSGNHTDFAGSPAPAGSPAVTTDVGVPPSPSRVPLRRAATAVHQSEVPASHQPAPPARRCVESSRSHPPQCTFRRAGHARRRQWRWPPRREHPPSCRHRAPAAESDPGQSRAPSVQFVMVHDRRAPGCPTALRITASNP
jgi:hypothetical protein